MVISQSQYKEDLTSLLKPHRLQRSMDNQEYVIVKAFQYKVMMVIAARFFSGLNDKIRLSFIHHPQNQILSKIFHGLESGFSGHFQAAAIIQVLLGYNNACIGWNKCDNETFTRSQIIKQAQNVNLLSRCVWKLHNPESKARDIYFDVCLSLVEDCKQLLRNVKPKLIMHGQLKRLSSGNDRNKKEYIEMILNYCQWGGQFERMYGEKIATKSQQVKSSKGKARICARNKMQLAIYSLRENSQYKGIKQYNKRSKHQNSKKIAFNPYLDSYNYNLQFIKLTILIVLMMISQSHSMEKPRIFVSGRSLEYVSVKASQSNVLMGLAVQHCLGLESRLRLSFIHQPQNINLGGVCHGLQSGFEGHFRAAQIILISMFKGDAYIGWNRLDDKTFTKKEIVRQAQNVDYLSRCVWKLLSPFQKSRDIYMDMSLRLVEDCREFFLGIKAEVILRGWQKRLTASASQHKREYFDRILESCTWKDRFLQKQGQKIATELISEEIATGKVFQGKNPHVCKEEDVIRYLI